MYAGLHLRCHEDRMYNRWPSRKCSEPGNEVNLLLLLVDETELCEKVGSIVAHYVYEEAPGLASRAFMNGNEELVLQSLAKLIDVTGYHSGEDGHPWGIVLTLCAALQLCTEGDHKHHARCAAVHYQRLLAAMNTKDMDADVMDDWFGEHGKKFIDEFIQKHRA